ncbi:MAG: hypothetical protein COB53_10705 [Elusimicrobia bacterium]|nr:MAG: hypothetical protein COB53_10705 [Elusimicrobiota bacterium]
MLTRKEIIVVFEEFLAGKRSRADVEEWAKPFHLDRENEVPEDKVLFDALTVATALDLKWGKDAPHEVDKEKVRAAIKKLRG